MRFSSFGSFVGAGLVGLSQASPVAQYVGTTGVESRSLAPIVPAVFNMAKNVVDETLYKGVVAPAIAGVQKEVDLVLGLIKADIAGDISVAVTDKFLIDPTIKIDLSGVKVYLEVDLEASAAVTTSVELMASSKLALAIPGLLGVDAGVAFALDLTLALSAAIDVEAGVTLTLPVGAYVEVSLLNKEIVGANLEGLVAQALPITLGADVELDVAVDLTLGLRLRTAVGIEAGLDILGLDLGAGAEVAIFVSLFDYTTTLIAVGGDAKCPVSVKEVFALVAGVAIELDVEVGDILDFHLAPSVLVTLATGASVEICLPSPDKPATGGSHAISTSATAVIGGSSTTATLPVSTNVNNVGSGSSETGSQVAPGAGTGYTTNSAGSLVPTNTGLGYPTTTPAPWTNSSATTYPAGGDMVTSTVTTTQVYTVTSCAVTVPNCPASMTQKIVTSTVEVYTTVCPATQTGAAPSSSYVPSSMPTPTGTPIPVTPCPTPSTSTYVAPTNVPTPAAPTVTIVDTTTYCPETAATGGATKPSTGATKPTSYPIVPTSYPAGGNNGGSGGNGGYTQVPPMSTGAGGVAAPTGTGSYTVPKPTGTPVTAGAGKVAGGAVAVVLPIVAALML